MGNVELIDPLQDPRWDKFVESHPFGLICHLSGWKRILENSFSHLKGHYLCLFKPDGETIQAALPVYEVKSWLTGTRLVSIPFATLCDPLISEEEDSEKLLSAATGLVKKTRAIYVEFRTFQSKVMAQHKDLGCSAFYKHHYLSLEKEPEELKKNFHRTCTRQRISRALKSELTLKVAEDEQDLIDFTNYILKPGNGLDYHRSLITCLRNFGKNLSQLKGSPYS